MSVRMAGRDLSADPRVLASGLRRAIGAMPRPLRAWYGVLILLCLVGAVGAALSIPPGWEVLGTSPSFEWGILIAAYVFFAITTSGLCLASSLGTVFGIEMFIPLEKRHAILALLCLVTAFGIIALDLHFPVRMVFGAVLSPSLRSPMWWMGVFYGAYLVFLVIEVASMFTGRWRIHRIACVLSSITAIVAPTTLGAVFGVLASRPYWHGAFTPPAMVSAALLSGTALLGIVFYGVHRFRLAGYERAERLAIPAIRLLLTITLAVTVLVVGWQIAWGLYGDVPGLSDATAAILVGPACAAVLVPPDPAGARGAAHPPGAPPDAHARGTRRCRRPGDGRALRRPGDLRVRGPGRAEHGGRGREVLPVRDVHAVARRGQRRRRGAGGARARLYARRALPADGRALGARHRGLPRRLRAVRGPMTRWRSAATPVPSAPTPSVAPTRSRPPDADPR